MKNTALTHIHEGLGAKMLPFAGYNMPILYAGVNVEHETVRNGVGVFDVSHMGEFMLSGPNALALIQKVTSNDAATLTIGRAQYSCLPNNDGGSVTMENLSDDYSLLAIQGPKAVEAMQSLATIDLSAIAYYHFEVAEFAGFQDIIISATGYTGSGGFEIYCKNDQVEAIWNKVFEAGAAFGIQPIGLAARDTLRLEMGFCLYGNDINDSTSPLEAGLGWITKFTKEFTNSENLKKQKETGVSKKLVAFEMQERAVPRHDYEIVDASGAVIGVVTSGTMSPSMNKGIGLGYVTTPNSAIDSTIYIRIRKNDVPATVVKLPFYKK